MIILEKYLEISFKKWKQLLVQIRYNKFNKTYTVYCVPCNNTTFGRETEAMSGFTDTLLTVDSRRSKSSDLDAIEVFYKREKKYLEQFKID